MHNNGENRIERFDKTKTAEKNVRMLRKSNYFFRLNSHSIYCIVKEKRRNKQNYDLLFGIRLLFEALVLLVVPS